MLLFSLLLCCGVALGASLSGTSQQPPDPPPSALGPREARSGLTRDTAWWSAPEPKWQSLQQRAPSVAAPVVSPSGGGSRSLRFTGEFQPSPNVELARDYRFEPYYRQDLNYDRNRDRDIYDSQRYVDYNRGPSMPPRRIIYYDDLSSKTKAPVYNYYPQQQPQPSNYDSYRYNAIRSPNIGVAPYRPYDQGRGINSIMSEGTVENAPLVDDPYRSYNPRQPAPWSVQVGTSLTVKDDGRHQGNAGRRYYVQSQREEPALARSMGYSQPSRDGSRLWAALQPRV